MKAATAAIVKHGEARCSLGTVKCLTSGAALYELPTPRIATGEPANLCIVDLEASFEVGADGYASRSQNCCFHGRKVHGRLAGSWYTRA